MRVPARTSSAARRRSVCALCVRAGRVRWFPARQARAHARTHAEPKLAARHLLHSHDLITRQEAVAVLVDALELLARLCDLVLVLAVLVLVLQRLRLSSPACSRDGGRLHQGASEEEHEHQHQIALHLERLRQGTAFSRYLARAQVLRRRG